MARSRPRLTILAIAALAALTVQAGVAAVKVRTDFDKAFNFQQAHTWGWNPERAGSVMVARTPDDDPDEIRGRAEPIILEAVNFEMPRRGLTSAATAPDLTLNYFLLLTVGTTAQTMGQFLPPVSAWAIPYFAPSTQSLKVIPQGSLVLDLSAKGEIVWRGMAEAEIKMSLSQAKRAELIREAVREILSRYPPKK